MSDKDLTPEQAEMIRKLVEKNQDMFIRNCSFALNVHEGCRHDPTYYQQLKFPKGE